MNKLYLYLFSFLQLASDFSGEHNLTFGNYLNEYKLPIVIDIPYYREDLSGFEVYEQILQPGDYYQAVKNENGYLYEKYGFMPDMASNVINKISSSIPWLHGDANKIFGKKHSMIEAALVSEYMPEWWIKDNLNSYISEGNDTNAIRNEISRLKDPFDDTDMDGLINREELLCGSNPLIKDDIVIKPKLLEIINDGSEILTGRFCVVNLSDSEIKAMARLYLKNDDFRYEAKLICSDKNCIIKGSEEFLIDVPARDKIYFAILFDSRNLPYSLYEYDFSIRINLDRFLHLTPYIKGDYSIKLETPSIKFPRNGDCIQSGKNIKFEWNSPGNDKRNALLKKYKHKKNVAKVLYKLQCIRADDSHVFFLNPKSLDTLKLNIEFDHFITKNDLLPGNYVWRVIEQTCFTCPVNSSWEWFSVGKKIGIPEYLEPKGPSLINNEGIFSQKDQSNYYVHDLTLGLAIDRFNNVLSSLSNGFFVSDLPRGIKLEKKSDHDYFNYYLNGAPEELGYFTNYWIGYHSQDSIVTQKHIFIVHNDLNKVLSCSYYHLNKIAVVHDLTVNIPFKFQAKPFYDEFYKYDDLVFDCKAEARFLLPLPEGIEGKRTNDGDFCLSGIPKVGGFFTNCFVISNNELSVEQKHIFRVRDIGEPIPRKKEKQIGNNVYMWDSNSERVRHDTLIGIPVRYFLTYDTKKTKWKDFIKDCRFELINELPKGLKIGMCDPFPYMNTNSCPPTIAIYGEAEEEGIFTNIIKYIEGDLTYTKKHIFYIRKEPVVYYR